MQDDLISPNPSDEGPLEDEWTIGDIARAYDVSLRTLRFYEDRGLLHPRRQGTARFYRAGDRIRLELILKGKRLGFTLVEVRDLIASRSKPVQATPDAENDLVVTLDPKQIVAQIALLQHRRDGLNCAIEELCGAQARMKVVVESRRVLPLHSRRGDGVS